MTTEYENDTLENVIQACKKNLVYVFMKYKRNNFTGQTVHGRCLKTGIIMYIKIYNNGEYQYYLRTHKNER